MSVGVSFGDLVRRRRRALDLTQAALARRVDCSVATVKKIEHDERRPSPTMASRLADALQVPAAQREAFVATGTGELAPARFAERARAGAPVPPSSAFVGREDHLAVLDRHLRGSLRDGARLVFVTGEAGQGKSALLAEFARRALASHDELVVARGFGTAANGIGDPYLLFRDVLGELAGADVGRTDGTLETLQRARIEAFAPFVTAAAAGLGRQLVDLLIPELAEGGALEPAGAASRDRLMGQAVMLLRALAEQRPLVLLLDDLQWSDSASMDLLFHLARRLGDAPVLVVGAYRASEVADAATPAATTLRRLALDAQAAVEHAVVDVGAFDPAAARRFCNALLDREPHRLDEAVRTKLFWQTRGHPLFVLELLRELQDRGALVRDADGAWTVAGDLDWGTVPSRVAAVISQRLDRLDERDRSLLDVAAVEGEHFTAGVLAEVSGLDPLEVCHALDRRVDQTHALAQATGTEQAGPRPLDRYRFRHVLFQQYLYDTMGASERRHLHLRVGEALERLHADATDVIAPRLAHHFAAAGNAERAVHWALRAGDRARVVYAHDEAVLHYQRAADLLRQDGDDDRLARALMKLGLSHQIAFDHDRAQAAYDEAFRLWGRTAAPGAGGAHATLRTVWREPPSMDPTMGGYNTTAPILTQLLSGLVAWGEDNEVVPDVAHAWTLEDDGRRMVFHLRDDVAWHDGVPVTAQDFAFTYRRALEPRTDAPIAPSLLAPVAGARRIRAGDHVTDEEFGVRALDDHTLVIELEQSTSWFLPNLAYYVLLPVPRHVVEAHGPSWAGPATFVGNGPFRLDAWDHEQSMTLSRNPAYHGSATGNVGRIELDLALPDEQIGAAYDRDELDLVTTFQAPLAEFATARRRHPSDHRRVPAFITLWLVPDLGRPPTDDPRVRRALALAIDRSAFAREVTHGLGDPATGGVVPAGMPGHVPGIGAAFDPAAARALLDEARVRHDREVVLAVPERGRGTGRFLQRAWDEVGFPVRLEVVPPEALARTDSHFQVGGWIADYPDPDTFLRVPLEPETTPGWPSQRYLDLLDEAARVTDQAHRLRLYEQAERILADLTLAIPLAYLDWHLLLKPWVTNFRVPSIKHPGFWHHLQVGEGDAPEPRPTPGASDHR